MRKLPKFIYDEEKALEVRDARYHPSGLSCKRAALAMLDLAVSFCLEVLELLLGVYPQIHSHE